MVVYVFLQYVITIMSSLSYGGVFIPTIWHYLYAFLSYGGVCILPYDITVMSSCFIVVYVFLP
jgi:hypothetical protein